ncbi:hypothetical protein ACPV5O_25700 [Vibrio maritimus]|uniref:DUF2913 family protein n=1 Tax=Vibrio maritimus TaxID=990268 RepID=UPI004069633E
MFEINEKAEDTQVAGAEKLYALPVYLNDEARLEPFSFEEGRIAKPDMLCMLVEHIAHCFGHDGPQTAPLSMLIQLERATELIVLINQHGWFYTEMKEWNRDTFHAQLLLHPIIEH